MWLLFADDPTPDNRPWWLAGTVSLIGVGYALVRFYFFMRDKSRRFRLQQDQDFTEQQAKARREAAQEAWEVVDRLSKQVEAHDEKIAQLEAKHEQAIREAEDRERDQRDRAARCEAEHAHTTGRLSIIEAWARSRGLKIPEVGTSGPYPRPTANPPTPPPQPTSPPTE